jgi:hypothetical protein
VIRPVRALVLIGSVSGCTVSFDPALLDKDAGADSSVSSTTASSSGGGAGAAGAGGGTGGAAGGAGGAGGAAPGYREIILDDEPLAYWRLGERSGRATAKDETGNHDGTYGGGVTLGASPALVGDGDTAAVFDGVGGYVEVGDVTELEFTGKASFSIEAWVRSTGTTSGTTYLVCKRHDNAAPDDDGYALSLFDSTEVRLTRVRAGAFDTVAGPIPIDQWTHVVGTFDGTDMTLYVDGAKIVAEESTAELVDIVEPVRLGGRSQGGDFLAGALDEVAVYGTALDYVTVANHFAAGQ